MAGSCMIIQMIKISKRENVIVEVKASFNADAIETLVVYWKVKGDKGDT